eukprot:3255777-Karenia_brevis.AAC.1
MVGELIHYQMKLQKRINREQKRKQELRKQAVLISDGLDDRYDAQGLNDIEAAEPEATVPFLIPDSDDEVSN